MLSVETTHNLLNRVIAINVCWQINWLRYLEQNHQITEIIKEYFGSQLKI